MILKIDYIEYCGLETPNESIRLSRIGVSLNLGRLEGHRISLRNKEGKLTRKRRKAPLFMAGI